MFLFHLFGCDSVKNRNEIEIIAFILQLANSGTTVKKIMSVLSMSYKESKDYLILLKKNDLLSEFYQIHEEAFMTTHKGSYFLEIYMELNKLVTIQDKRNFASDLYTVLATRIRRFEYAIYYIQYFATVIRSLIQFIFG
jgi:predicted transcriptional regulator